MREEKKWKCSRIFLKPQPYAAAGSSPLWTWVLRELTSRKLLKSQERRRMSSGGKSRVPRGGSTLMMGVGVAGGLFTLLLLSFCFFSRAVIAPGAASPMAIAMALKVRHLRCLANRSAAATVTSNDNAAFSVCGVQITPFANISPVLRFL